MKTLGPPKTKTSYNKLFLYHTEPDAPIDPFIYYDIQKLTKDACDIIVKLPKKVKL